MSSPMNVGPGLGSRIPPQSINPHIVPAYSLIVAGATHAGKSSLLRLILDTAPISPHATQAHLDSLARFVRTIQHPTEPRFAECEVEVLWGGERVLLRLVDSPGLDVHAEDELERGLRDILSYVEARYVEGARDESTVGESHVHLCLYVLDPSNIVPRATSHPFRRTSSASSSSSSSYSPPSPTTLHPSLTLAEINAIRRLSSRVNVLPVLGRCDAIGVDLLAEIKRAVRRDLADAGLGFGIFDEDGETGVAPTALPAPKDASTKQDPPSPVPASQEPSQPAEAETVPLLPYALFAPDCYAPSARKLGKRELVGMYAAAAAEGGDRDREHDATGDKDTNAAKDAAADVERLETLKGRYVRRYRWGVLDTLDGRHSDFAALRRTAMKHRKVLKTYTKDYLYEKFKVDSLLAAQQQPPRVGIVHASPQPHAYERTHAHLPLPVSVPAYRQQVHPHHQHPLPPIVPSHAHAHPGSVHALLNHAAPVREDVVRARDVEREREREREVAFKRERDEREAEEGVPVGGEGVGPVTGAAANGRKRKITMACNFCRSRKLKCDGIRPACAQCVKRGNTCDYQPQGNAGTAAQGQAAASWKPRKSTTASFASAPAPAPAAHPHDVDPRIDDPRAVRHGLDVRRQSISHPHPHAHPHHPQAHHPHAHARDEDVDELDDEGSSSEDDARTVYGQEGRKRVSVDMLIAETLGDGKPGAPPPSGAPAGPTSAPAPVPPPIPAPPPSAPYAQRVSPGYAYANGSESGGAPWFAETTAEGAMGNGMGVIDVGSEGDKKKRLNRQSANYGSKAVACVHCRARKTRCDAARPACGNCARRSLACSYIHTQPSQPRSKGKKAAAAAAAKEEAARQAAKANGEPTPPPMQYHSGSPHGSHESTRESSQRPSHERQSQWASQSPSRSPHPHHSHVHAHQPSRPPVPSSPVPGDIVIEESAERDRPRSPPRVQTRSPAAPPIATLAPSHASAPSPAPPIATLPNGNTKHDAVFTNGTGAKHDMGYSNGNATKHDGLLKSPRARTPERGLALTVDTHTGSRSRSSSVVAVPSGKRKSSEAGSDEERDRPDKRRKWLEEGQRVEGAVLV